MNELNKIVIKDKAIKALKASNNAEFTELQKQAILETLVNETITLFEGENQKLLLKYLEEQYKDNNEITNITQEANKKVNETVVKMSERTKKIYEFYYNNFYK